MSLFNTLNTGITGLSTNGMALSVIGDNISHLNTTGFKGSTAQFEDLVVQKLGQGRGERGLGSSVAKVRQSFAQGALEGSSRNGDVAIDGRGFFVVANSEGGNFYTRAGQFDMTSDGFLTDPSGNRLQGYGVTAPGGPLGTAVGDLNIPTAPLPATVTTEIGLTANLAPGTNGGVPSAPPVIAPGDGFDVVTDAADFTTSMTVYDSLGQSHDLTVAFFETGSGAWTYSAYVDAGETGGTAGEPLEIATGTLAFDTSGNLDPTASTVTPR